MTPMGVYQILFFFLLILGTAAVAAQIYRRETSDE